MYIMYSDMNQPIKNVVLKRITLNCFYSAVIIVFFSCPTVHSEHIISYYNKDHHYLVRDETQGFGSFKY